MKNRNSTVLKTALILLITLIPVTALSAGKIIIKPTLSATWKSDSNFFKAETNERDVYTYIFTPGIEFGYTTAKSLVSLKYSLSSHDYNDEDSLRPGWTPADREDYTGHNLNLKMRTRPFKRLTLGLDESYILSRDPANSDAFSNAVDRDKFTINRLTPLMTYDFNDRFSAGLKYRHTDTDYDLVTREDSTEKRPIVDIIYNLNRKTSLDLEYQHWTRDYDLATSDYTSDQVKLILRRQFNYFSLEAGAGSHDRDFDDPALEDIDTMTYRVGLIGQNPPAPDENPRSRIAIIGERNFNDSGSGDSYFISNRFTLDAGYVYRERIPFGFRATYQENDYERTTGLTPAGITTIREDDLYTVEGSVGYIFTDWVRLITRAGYESRDSNIAGKDYDNRYIMATIDFSYNIGKR
ncbi:MAG: outer membrane beta-barrel protein [Deltaproteobacteria bacterium]|nr:outer membrane beta-barrel protein [Deltaproteobacteria bacterium]